VPAVKAQQTPRPRDLPYPGIIELQVDATNVGQRIFKVHERIPVKTGALTLLYPQWRLGAHAPAGMALSQFSGLMLSANHQSLEWKRDPLDMYAFHVEVLQRGRLAQCSEFDGGKLGACLFSKSTGAWYPIDRLNNGYIVIGTQSVGNPVLSEDAGLRVNDILIAK